MVNMSKFGFDGDTIHLFCLVALYVSMKLTNKLAISAIKIPFDDKVVAFNFMLILLF